MLSLAYFLHTVRGWLPFSDTDHADHPDEKDTSLSLNVFKSYLSVLLLCGSFLAAGLLGNLISVKADLRCVLFFRIVLPHL